MICSTPCSFVLVGALLVGCRVGELDASTDVVVVVAPNLVRDPLSHPSRLQRHRDEMNPPLWAGSEMHQPILGLDTAPRPLRLMIWA